MSQSLGQQVSPNPNPAGNTITLDSTGWYNSEENFFNHGEISITSSGSLTTYTYLTNYEQFSNAGLFSAGTTESHGVLENHGTFNNTGAVAIEFGLFNGPSAQLLNNSSIQIAANGTLYNLGSVQSSGSIVNYGTLQDLSGAGFVNLGGIENHANFNVTTSAGTGLLTNSGNISNAGEFRSNQFHNTGTITNSNYLNAGDITNHGGISSSGAVLVGSLNNQGNVATTTDNAFFDVGNYTSGAGASLALRGNSIFSNSCLNGAASTITVQGTARFNGSLTNQGIFSQLGHSDLRSEAYILSFENSGRIETFGELHIGSSSLTVGPSSNSGVIDFNGLAYAHYANIANTGTLNVNGHLTWGSPTANQGAINISSSGLFHSYQCLNSGTLNNSGTIYDKFIWNKEAGTVFNSGSITNEPFALKGSITNSGIISNTGLIDTGDLGNGGSILNNGTLQANYFASGAGVLQNEGTASFNQIHLQGGEVRNSGAMDIYKLRVDSGSIVNEQGGTLVVGGAESGTLSISGLLENHGNLEVLGNWWAGHGNLYIDAIASASNTGNITISSGAAFSINGQLSNNGTINNHGVTGIGGTLSNQGIFNNYYFLDVSGIFSGSGVVNNFGAIVGSGLIDTTVIDAGTLAPGNSPGVLTINGELRKVSGSLEIEIGGDFDGGGDHSLTEFDWLDVSGNVSLAGTLEVLMWNGFQLVDGLSFKIINVGVGGLLSGQFTGLSEGGKVGTYGNSDMFITYAGGDGNDVVLYSVSSVPEPGSVGLIFAISAVGALFHRQRPTSRKNSIAA
ncbi:MAG: beta strand repeat-containing protein [Planctomycetota bacterium]